MFKDAAKNLIKAVTPAFASRWPVGNWPGWLGRMHGVKVPRAVVQRTPSAPTGSANINILLEMVERTKGLEGDIAECGVFQGGSLVAMGLYLRQQGIRKRVFGFDSFEGFDPVLVKREMEFGGAANDEKHAHGFHQTSEEMVMAKVRRFGLVNVELIRGYFNDTLKTFTQSDKFCFVHLDVDLYDSYRDCLEFFYPRTVSGGVILLDEYNDPPWPGCNKAVDMFLSDKKEKLEKADRDGYEKWYFVKL